VLENSLAKIESKNLDIIVTNDITKEGAGFNTDTNIVNIINKNGNRIDLPKMSKVSVANILLDEIKNLI
jgi:phosphopantothenoylcysteine decarboxylase/phosphopantothenate--cysteine ligase